VQVYGEAFIEEGIPASDFSDGWAVTFDHFLITIADVTAARGQDAPALSAPTPRVYELARPTMGVGQPVATAEVPGGAYDNVAYRVRPAPAGVAAAPGADAARASAMAAAGESVHVVGTARKGDRTLRFAWGFTSDVLYRGCESEARVDGGTARTQLTIHGDHLFFDDLVSEDPKLAFDLVAASDTDGDGQVTKAELQARDITGQARYQVGGERITNLWDFIARQVTNLGHIDGEGHCQMVVP
jgi:hypothetical protein